MYCFSLWMNVIKYRIRNSLSCSYKRQLHISMWGVASACVPNGMVIFHEKIARKNALLYFKQEVVHPARGLYS